VNGETTDLNAEHPRTSVGGFFRALLGNMLLLLVLVAVERIFFGPGTYSSLIQHPFWIVVLVAAVLDGLYVGVLIAAAATLLMDWPARPGDADITTHYIQIAILPLQWLLAALCIGLFRDAELKRDRATRLEMLRLRHASDVLAADISNLEAQIAHEQLQKLSTDTTSGSKDKLIKHVLELQGSSPDELHSAFGSLARLTTSLPAYLFTLNKEGALELDARCPEPSGHLDPKFETDLLHAIRNSAVAILERAETEETGSTSSFTVVVGITSPDRRLVHGAVALFAENRAIANESVDAAKFLASVLGPVLTRFRAPRIAAWENSLIGSIRSIRRG
jgi:hypothetical protein